MKKRKRVEKQRKDEKGRSEGVRREIKQSKVEKGGRGGTVGERECTIT